MNTDNYSHDDAFHTFLLESAVKSTINGGYHHMYVPQEVRYYTEQFVRFYFHEQDKQQRFKEKYDED